MFTGIVEETGIVAVAGARLKIACRAVIEDAVEGSSLAVNGTCLTAVRIDPEGFWADLSPETLARTNLGALAPGDAVNLERPVALGSRLGGHIVQGHADGTAELIALEELPDGNWWLRVRIPAELDRYVIMKGSIALDGIALTVAALENREVGVAIIPYTYAHTSLRSRKPGDRLNLEVDMIAKYVEKLTASATGSGA